MKYRVIWLPNAEQELTAIWLDTKSRDAVTRAAHAIDEQLEDDPLNTGESRDKGERITFTKPLAVRYYPVPDQKTVFVVRVWKF